IELGSGAVEPIGEPGLYTSVETSPDEHWILVTRLKRPFSYRVPYYFFARSVEIWDPTGHKAATVATLPISDEVPRQGVPTGPRAVGWQPLQPVSLFWVEAQDGGNPMTKVPHRDRLMRLAAPFTAAPQAIGEVSQRFVNALWTARRDIALVTEYDRDRRWRTTSLVNLASGTPPKVLFDLSAQDAYHDPGVPVLETRP